MTFGTILAYFIVIYNLTSHIKRNHPELYSEFGEGRVWYSAPDQIRFFKFLFTFGYLGYDDKRLKILAILTKVLLIASMYFIFTRPIFFRGSLSS